VKLRHGGRPRRATDPDTGGTGGFPRDITPEATRLVIERSFRAAEAMRARSLQITPHGHDFRGWPGICKGTLISTSPQPAGAPRKPRAIWRPCACD